MNAAACACLGFLGLACSAGALAQAISAGSTSPDQLEGAPVSTAPMSAMQMSAMQMNDAALYGALMIDQLELRDADRGASAAWQAEGWYGGDYDKLWVRTEGEEGATPAESADLELLWDRVISSWWSVQAGGREDLGTGPSRSWAAAGVRGLAPYDIAVEATGYVGDDGRTAARLRIESELLITERVVLQAELEANAYGESDGERRLGRGLADVDAGLRWRYDLRRDLGPYLGVAFTGLCGATAERARAAHEPTRALQVVAGVRALL